MRRTIQFTLLASTVFLPASAMAQEPSVEELRARISALEAQIGELSAMVEALEEQDQADAAPVPAPAPAPSPAPDSDRVAVTWQGAPEIEGGNGWSFKPRGRLNVDAGFFDAPDSTGAVDGFGSELRRARIGVEGTIPGNFGYKLEIDFASNAVSIADAVVSYDAGPVTIKAGHQKPFKSLDELTSSRFTSFIERAAFTDAFGFERKVGLSAEYSGGAVLAQGGVFSDNSSDLPSTSWTASGRLVLMPEAAGAQWHLGVSADYSEPDERGIVRYRQRPLVHFTDERFINTTFFPIESEFGLGLEGAVIAGPFHAAAEGFRQETARPGGLEDAQFHGGYLEAGLFLTPGDSRGYKDGAFGRTRPVSPLDEGGIGAIQVNFRYDYLDLVDAGVVGGRQNGYLASLIWTPTAYTRFLLNGARLEYDQAILPAGPSDRSYSVHTVAMRAQVDF